MNRLRTATRWSGLFLTIAALASPALAQPQENPNAPGIAGVEVLTRGPVHEAFAEPVVFDPKAGPVIGKEPPPQVEEMPPDQKPEGANVQWIPGYWSWDDGRNDYLWVSGIWRDVPPGRQWVPGYWSQVAGGFQWTPGAWVASEQTQVEYLPEPPQSLEVGPNGPAPAADATWAPGCWYWQDTRYVWRPGFWVPFQPHWLWVPAHFIWTPNGYLYVNGYWDHPLTTRGLAFAPVYFQQPLYAQPSFVFTPTVGLLATALASSLFVRPAYNQYCFGDYFAASHYQAGIYPWYSYHESRYGYDPIFSHYAAVHTRRDPHWVAGLRDEYRYRRDHPDARPAHTFVQQQTIVNNITNVNVRNVNVTKVQNLVIGRPIQQLALREGGAAPRPGVVAEQSLRFERLDDSRRKAFAQRAVQLNEFRQQRIRREQELVRREPGGGQAQGPGRGPKFPDRPRRVEFARSPVAATPLAVQERREANAAREAAKAERAAESRNGAREAQAAKAARAAENLNAAREAQAANAARAAEARKAAREAQGARAAENRNAVREAEAAKAARAAESVRAAREAQAGKAARAAEARNAAREAQAAQAAENRNAVRNAEAAKAARAAEARNAVQETQARRAAEAANAANAANAAREAQAANAAREAQARKAAREMQGARAAEAAKAAREQQAAQAARAAEARNAAREANAARAANAANAANQQRAAQAAREAEAANARARMREQRNQNPPPAPAQPAPDLNRRPGNPNQFRQQRHDPDLNQIPPRFRRPTPENPQPAAKAQQREGGPRGRNKPDND